MSRTTTARKSAVATFALYGNTYPVKDKLAALGGRPRKDESGKWYWEIPVSREAEARALVPAYGTKAAPARPDNAGRWAAFKPTDEQADIATFIKNQSGNLFMKAGAGCGKTTVSLWLLSQMVGTKVMVAFNTAIKDDIEKKASGDTQVLTMNALGYRALNKALDRKVVVDAKNTMTVIKAMVGEGELKARYGFYKAAADLVSKAKGQLAESIEDLGQLAEHYEIRFGDSMDSTNEGVAFAKKVLDRQRSVALYEIDTIDFDDQQWLPVIHNLAMPTFDVMVIDESQDTNPLQLEMLSRCVNADGRVIAVGDPRQAINGFRGADKHAIEKIVERFDMTTLPLMTTFRCGKAIVAEAQAIVPDFRAGENNHEGEVCRARPHQFFADVNPGDLVLSRTNAPLASACLRLLQQGVPATIVGRNGDLVAQLLKLIEKTRAKTVPELEAGIEAWFAKEQARITRKLPIREEAIEAARDKADTVLAFAENADSLDEVRQRIERCFSAQENGVVELSTVHKAKGREAKSVWLFSDTFMLRRKDRKTGEWLPPSEEEENLLYVGITRAMNRLTYVDGMKKMQRS